MAEHGRSKLPETPYARVLFVDDERDVARLCGRALSKAGYQVALAYDGRSALEKIAFFKPHLVVMNFAMPVMDGYEALTRLRDDPKTARLKVIMTSASPGDLAASRKAGAQGFLEKPFSMATLVDAAHRVLGTKPSAAA